MTPVMLPPDAGLPVRQEIDRWASMWNRTEHQIAPAYPRQWGSLLAGLMQAQPPRFDPPAPDTFPMNNDTLADLTDTAVPYAAAFGAAYMRPVVHDGVWSVSVLKPTNVHATYRHQQLQQTLVWDWDYDPRSSNRRDVLAFVETWADGDVQVRVFEGTRRQAGTVILGELIGAANTDQDSELPPKLAAHPYAAAIVGHDRTERQIVPYVWKWDDGRPVPIFAALEPMIDGLCRLWTQEQEDAEMARNRIAVAQDALSMVDVYTDDHRLVSSAGFNPSDNVLALAPGMNAQNPGEGGVQVITFPDHLTQRERIERRENSALEAIGINPQSVGRSVSGRSDSAAAKRADQQMTANTIAGPARRWQAALVQVAAQAGRLAGQTVNLSVNISDGVKPNMAERVDLVAAASAAEAMSTRTKIETIHPEWDAPAVDAELVRMGDEGLLIVQGM